MKKKDVSVGKMYLAKISGKIVPVRLESESQHGGWEGRNTVTGRSVRIRSAAKLRREVFPTSNNDHAIKHVKTCANPITQDVCIP